MKQATIYSMQARRALGLPNLASPEDAAHSVEQSGTPTDHHRALASKIYGVPYDLVTRTQREAAKKINFWSMYQ